MSSSNGEFEMAVAAAAYAIASMDEESFWNKKSPLEEMKLSDKSKSKREGSTSTRINFIGSVRWFSNKEAKDDSKSAGKSRRVFINVWQLGSRLSWLLFIL